MTKNVTVFTEPESELQQMEEVAVSHHIAVGPFCENNEAKLVEFLSTKLHRLRAVCHKETSHQLYLYLKPGSSGWLIELLNRYSHLGLNQAYISGLVLDATDYRGSLAELSKEAAAFFGKKFLWYKMDLAKSFYPVLNQVKGTDFSGIYLCSDEPDERTGYNLTVGHLTECKVSGLALPVWTTYFAVESRRALALYLGSSGHHAALG